MTAKLLEKLVPITLASDPDRLVLLMRKIPKVERNAYIQSHPLVVLDLFRDNADDLLDILGDENITVDMMGYILIHYPPYQARDLLLDVAERKKGIAEGILLARPDLYVCAPYYCQKALADLLGNTVIEKIRMAYKELDSMEKEKQRTDKLQELRTTRESVLSYARLLSPRELRKFKLTIQDPQPNGRIKKEIVSVATLERDFEAMVTNLNTADIADISLLIDRHHSILGMLQSGVQAEDLIDTTSYTVRPEITQEPTAAEIPGTTPSVIGLQQQWLIYARNTVQSSPKFSGDQKEKAVASIEEAMVDQFEKHITGMKKETDPYKLTQAAEHVLWYVGQSRARPRNPFKGGREILTDRFLDNVEKEANAAILRAKGPSGPKRMFEKLKPEQEAYYNLSNTQRAFVGLVERMTGGNKFTLSKGIATQNSGEVDAIVQRIANSVAGREADLYQRYKALGGTLETTLSNKALKKLSIAVQLLDMGEAPDILAAVKDTIFYEGDMSADLVVKVVRGVHTRLGIRYKESPDYEKDIQQKWEAVVEDLYDGTEVLGNATWIELEQALERKTGKELSIIRDTGSFTIERDTGALVRSVGVDPAIKIAILNGRVSSVTDIGTNSVISGYENQPINMNQVMKIVTENSERLLTPEEIVEQL